MPETAAPEPADMTIEQLATEVGLPYTTIRMYQHRGLLPPPQKRGRVGYYDADHLARLRLIGQLQEKGYSLAAIKDLVETWQSGATLTDVLRIERSAVDVLDGGPPLRLRPEELARRFPPEALDPEVMQRAFALGLFTLDGDAIEITTPAFLDVGSQLVEMGIPVTEVLDEYEHLRVLAADLADRFAGLFERHLWGPFVADGMPPDRLSRLTDDLARLTPLAQAIVDATLRQALAAVAARFLDEQATALASPSDAPRAKKDPKRPGADATRTDKDGGKKDGGKKARNKKARTKKS